MSSTCKTRRDHGIPSGYNLGFPYLGKWTAKALISHAAILWVSIRGRGGGRSLVLGHLLEVGFTVRGKWGSEFEGHCRGLIWD